MWVFTIHITLVSVTTDTSVPINTALDACAMVVTIVAFVATSWPVDPVAAWLFVPYLVWTSFAAALNLSILRLNASSAH